MRNVSLTFALGVSLKIEPILKVIVISKLDIFPFGAYVTLYMRDCSHYEMREKNGIYLMVFPKQYIHATSLFRSNNVKLQPNLKYYILLSDKNQRWRWLQAIRRAQQRLRFCTPRYR